MLDCASLSYVRRHCPPPAGRHTGETFATWAIAQEVSVPIRIIATYDNAVPFLAAPVGAPLVLVSSSAGSLVELESGARADAGDPGGNAAAEAGGRHAARQLHGATWLMMMLQGLGACADGHRHFPKPAKRVGQAHLLRCAALRAEQRRARNNDRETFGA